MKFVVFTIGPGETSHGYAVTKHLLAQNHQVTMALLRACNQHFCQPAPQLSIEITTTHKELQKLVHRIKPDAVILCNSKAFNTTSFVTTSPWKHIPTFSVDSNWLFDTVGPHRHVEWLDAYFIVFPEAIFQLGYKENGGHFHVPLERRSRIHPVGFIPSYQKPAVAVREKIRQQLGVQQHEKLIFCYVSGHAARMREYILANLVRVVKQLRAHGQVIKVLAIGNFDLIEDLSPYEADWIQLQNQVTSEDFYHFLASSDLVFQHQGHGTLSQSITAQIPVIVNIEVRPDIPYPLIPLAENMAFQQAGLCQLLYSHSPLEEIQQMIETCLYDEQAIHTMQRAQQHHAIRGEVHLYSFLMKHLKGQIPDMLFPLALPEKVEKKGIS